MVNLTIRHGNKETVIKLILGQSNSRDLNPFIVFTGYANIMRTPITPTITHYNSSRTYSFCHCAILGKQKTLKYAKQQTENVFYVLKRICLLEPKWCF